jgi:hypothetical protein
MQSVVAVVPGAIPVTRPVPATIAEIDIDTGIAGAAVAIVVILIPEGTPPAGRRRSVLGDPPRPPNDEVVEDVIVETSLGDQLLYQRTHVRFGVFRLSGDAENGRIPVSVGVEPGIKAIGIGGNRGIDQTDTIIVCHERLARPRVADLITTARLDEGLIGRCDRKENPQAAVSTQLEDQ